MSPTGRAKKRVDVKFDLHVYYARPGRFALLLSASPYKTGSERASRFDPAIDKNKLELDNCCYRPLGR